MCVCCNFSVPISLSSQIKKFQPSTCFYHTQDAENAAIALCGTSEYISQTNGGICPTPTDCQGTVSAAATAVAQAGCGECTLI